MADTPRNKSYEAFGNYVRSQRKLAQLSLRQAAELARISNPYLSQIEHGLALPSVTVIRALANALEVSADSLLLQAAGVAGGDLPEGSATTEYAIRHDRRLGDAQKHALLAVLRAFTEPARRDRPAPARPKATAPKKATTAQRATSRKRASATKKATAAATPKATRRHTPAVLLEGERSS